RRAEADADVTGAAAGRLGAGMRDEDVGGVNTRRLATTPREGHRQEARAASDVEDARFAVRLRQGDDRLEAALVVHVAKPLVRVGLSAELFLDGGEPVRHARKN